LRVPCAHRLAWDTRKPLCLYQWCLANMSTTCTDHVRRVSGSVSADPSGVRGPDTSQAAEAQRHARRNSPAISAACEAQSVLAHPVQLHLHMKIAELKRLSRSNVRARQHERQDTAIATAHRPWHKQRRVHMSRGCSQSLLVALVAWLIHAWSNAPAMSSQGDRTAASWPFARKDGLVRDVCRARYPSSRQ